LGLIITVHQPLTLKNSICSFHFGAQCFPRLACPLNGAVLMQVHEPAQAAPGLVREGVKKVNKHMQNHAPCGCMA
jgi:hypothetical protein